VHCLVTGCGVSTGASPCWHHAPPTLPLKAAIAKLVCGKLRASFAQKRPDLIIPATAWTTPWVVRITREFPCQCQDVRPKRFNIYRYCPGSPETFSVSGEIRLSGRSCGELTRTPQNAWWYGGESESTLGWHLPVAFSRKIQHCARKMLR